MYYLKQKNHDESCDTEINAIALYNKPNLINDCTELKHPL